MAKAKKETKKEEKVEDVKTPEVKKQSVPKPTNKSKDSKEQVETFKTSIRGKDGKEQEITLTVTTR